MKLHGERRTIELEEGDSATLHITIAGRAIEVPLSADELHREPWSALDGIAYEWSRQMIERAVIVIEEADR